MEAAAFGATEIAVDWANLFWQFRPEPLQHKDVTCKMFENKYYLNVAQLLKPLIDKRLEEMGFGHEVSKYGLPSRMCWEAVDSDDIVPTA